MNLSLILRAKTYCAVAFDSEQIGARVVQLFECIGEHQPSAVRCQILQQDVLQLILILSNGFCPVSGMD